MKSTSAAAWIALLVISGVGEAAAFIMAVIFGVAAMGQTDAAEGSRLWASAGWWLLGSVMFTAVSVWALVRVLRVVATQAPGAVTEIDEP